MKRSGWLDRYSYEESLGILKEFALAHASQAGRYSHLLDDFIRRSDWVGLLDVELDYRDTDDYLPLYHARQALAFFQKFEPLKLDEVESKTLRAFRSFAKSELTCALVNDRFSNYCAGTSVMGYPYDVILTDAREKIARVLGDWPGLDALDLGFGPGATVSTIRSDSCPRSKLGEPLTCSHELEPFVDRLLSSVPSLALLHATESGLDFADVQVRLAEGKLQFVPKDAKKFRTIIVEPGLNVLFQQGIGKAVRKRLKKAGVDLDSQERNRELAKSGSQTNSLATVDFSSASDTISTQLVAFLLPESWFCPMSLGRTGTVTFEKHLHIRLEKFSTMGNSFTFELESLIFWALAWSTLRFLQLSSKDLSIFGDDLIIPRKAFPLCELVFAFCGFTINSSKSFVSGPFRESCGGDFFKGIDIRPYYQKDLVTPESLFTLHNYYMRTFQFSEASRVRSLLHPDLIIFGPDGFGDGHLIGDWTPSRRKKITVRVRKGGREYRSRVTLPELGWEGGFFESFSHVHAEDLRRNHGDSLLPAYSIYKRGNSEEPTAQSSSQGKLWADPKHFTVPGSVGYKKTSIYTWRRGVFLP